MIEFGVGRLVKINAKVFSAGNEQQLNMLVQSEEENTQTINMTLLYGNLGHINQTLTLKDFW